VMDLPHDMVGERYALLRYGGGGAPGTLVCGVVRFDHHTAPDLLRALPPLVHVRTLTSPHAEWMQTTLQLMAVEARKLMPGGETIVTRLADILVVQAIRAWLASDSAAHGGWLGALKDRQIGRAIALIHRDPARPWTVDSLAAEAAMSRSAFAARFTGLVGETPLRYVTRVRMRLARSLLGEQGATIEELAGRVRYQSEAAFCRTFKRLQGVSPGAVRRASVR
jgi:AraC-like DNA-binding protein